MKTIEYQVAYNDGQPEILQVSAQTINSGFSKALRLALRPLGDGRRREIAWIRFWQVKS